jgi:hypothetical protein
MMPRWRGTAATYATNWSLDTAFTQIDRTARFQMASEAGEGRLRNLGCTTKETQVFEFPYLGPPHNI